MNEYVENSELSENVEQYLSKIQASQFTNFPATTKRNRNLQIVEKMDVTKIRAVKFKFLRKEMMNSRREKMKLPDWAWKIEELLRKIRRIPSEVRNLGIFTIWNFSRCFRRLLIIIFSSIIGIRQMGYDISRLVSVIDPIGHSQMLFSTCQLSVTTELMTSDDATRSSCWN